MTNKLKNAGMACALLLASAALSATATEVSTAPASAAAVSTAPAASEPPGMRIVQSDGMDAIINFWSGTLKNARNVRVLLPRGYDQSKTKYPVLYMMDGQNLFFRRTSFLGIHWKAMETARALMSSGKTGDFILVAVDNTPERITEFTFDKNISGEGGGAERFADFMCRELIPYIDTNYKTVNDASGRFTGGAGLGGNVSLYLLASRPDSFSGAAVMSPDMYWNNGSIAKLAASAKFAKSAKVWLDVGMLEGSDNRGTRVLSGATKTLDLYYALLGNGLKFGENFMFRLDPAGTADEASWGARFSNPLLFFFGKNAGEPENKPMVSASKVGLNGVPPSVMLWNTLKYPNGLTADYVPQTAKASPPYLMFDKGFFSFMHGAEAGPVKLYAIRGTHNFSRMVQIVKTQSQDAELRINLTVPADTPAGSKVYISGEGNLYGNWAEGKIQLAQDTKKKNLWHFSTRVQRGSAAVFKFTLGSWSKVERDAEGYDVPNRAYKMDLEKNVLNLKVLRWTPPPQQDGK